ncbi:hypothetical protein [Salinispora arenicola]|uniref:hypothetical protein n=1 Tax=Salinispora arenicola TaxID=168697 RepID=UPI0003A8A7F6|nr:hypothetical protein [Salinispora arenicola]
MSQPPTDPAEPSSQPAVPGSQPAVPGQPAAEDAGYDRYAQGAAVPPPQGGAVPPPQDEPGGAGSALPSPATSSPPGPALAAGDNDAPAPPGPAGYGPAPSDYPPAEPFGGAGSALPSSGPPAEQPTVALPMSAAPMSGPPTAGVPTPGPPTAGPPTAGPPMFGVPYGAGPARARPGRTMLILAVVAGLLFITGAVMTGLFLNTAGDLNRAEKQLSQRDATIAANTEELDEVKVDLLRTQDALANAQQDLTGTQNDRDEQARQKEVIATCLDRLTTALAAAAIGDRKAHEKANEDLEEVCAEAENYL